MACAHRWEDNILRLWRCRGSGRGRASQPASHQDAEAVKQASLTKQAVWTHEEGISSVFFCLWILTTD